MDIHPPFSEQEKRFVLAEAIKLSSIPVDRLLALLSEGNVQPAWSQMLLPYGRNLQSCIDTFEVLRAGYGQPSPYSALPLPNPSHKRKSVPENLEPLMTGPQPKRRQSGVETVPPARDIRPKPTSSNGSPHPFSALPGQPPAPAKKRGRPSKADVEERNREAIARGEVLPPPKAMTPKGGKQPVTGEPSSAGYAAIAPMVTAPPEQSGGVQYQAGPIEAGMTTTAAPTAPGDSPGKRKRARPAPRQPKVPKPGEGSFSIAPPQMTQPQAMEAPQLQTPNTPSPAFAQPRPAEAVPISQLVQPTPTESQGQPPPEQPSQPEPRQPSA